MSGTGAGNSQRSGRARWIHSTRLHLVLYSFLLVYTPFILLQNYLIDLVSDTSRSTFELGSLHVPVVPIAAGVLLLLGILRFRRSVTRRMLAAAGIVVLMDTLAQQITDYYFGHRFYDLQQNWHYIAYGLFAFMVYRDLIPRRLPLARILWLTYFGALGFSLFDEFFQRQISSRVFDLSDTSKDLWGCLMGMVLIYLGGQRSQELLRGWSQIRQKHVGAHFRNPLTSLLLMVAFCLIFLCVTALLSDPQYAWTATGTTVALCVVFLAAFTLLFTRAGRIVLAAAVLALLGIIGYGSIRRGGEPITHARAGLTVYQGVPLPFFDVMFRPDGSFRLVDKKHFFNQRDQDFLLRQKCDIIVIGSGEKGLGGLGFPERSMVQFLYNPYLDRATQVITLRTPEACRLFNRLRQEKKSVLFILHNTC